MSEQMPPYRASCLCGTVRFEAHDFGTHAGHCHCSMCRKFHGAQFATIASVPRSAFHWIQGQEDVAEFTASNGTTRSFCRNCGSSLFFASPRADPEVIEVALAVFDDPVPITPDAHIFVSSGAAWSHIADGLPKYEDGRSSPRLD